MTVLPIFKSQYSLGKSILTVNAPDKLDRDYPISIFDIAKTHGLTEVVLVDDSISGFLEAYHNAKKANIKLIYGIRLQCMENIQSKNDAALKTIHKVIVLIKNSDGYKDLIKISSCAAREGFYYKPNIDMTNLKRLWTDNLIMAVPFYDSFLFNNSLYGHRCIPSFSFTKPSFFIENSQLPFDVLMQNKVQACAATFQADVIQSRSIYYYKKEDFLAYLTFRCINERTLIEKPELEHMSSNNFSFEEWERQEKAGNING